MIIRIKKTLVHIALLITLMILGLPFVYAACSGTDLFTVRIFNPSHVEVASSAQQTISPTGGTDCNNADSDSATISVYCQENGTYYANVTCDSCSSHSAAANTDIVTCYSSEINKFAIRNSSGEIVAAFDEKGYLYLRGFNYSNQGSLSPPPNSYIIKSPAGATVAYINSTGDLLVAGELDINQGSFTAPKSSFVIRNGTGQDVAYVDSEGNLNLTGLVYFNWTVSI